MQSDTPVGGHSAGRPRSIKVRQAILTTALRLAQQEGFSALTIEGIAHEAGVGKPTIYRWWTSKAAIVFEALQQHAQHALPLPPAGPLAERLETWLEMIFQTLNEGTGKIVSGLMAEAQRDPVFATFFRNEFILVRRRPLLAILHEGLRRAELPADTDCEVMADLIYGAMWYRLLAQHAPLDDTFAHDIVRTLLYQSAIQSESTIDASNNHETT